MENTEAKIEARRQELERMGEPPSSQRYLLELEFNGERVVVERPNWPATYCPGGRTDDE